MDNSILTFFLIVKPKTWKIIYKETDEERDGTFESTHFQQPQARENETQRHWEDADTTFPEALVVTSADKGMFLFPSHDC